MKKQTEQPEKPVLFRLIASLLLLSAVSAFLLASRIIDSQSLRYNFLLWNLFLAAIPVFLAWWLAYRIRQFGWLKWQQIGLTFAWFAFLPNSFYIITDLIHLRATYEADLLFDVVLLMSFIINGLVLGYISVYLVHRELIKRLSYNSSYAIIAVLFLAVSFAICLGRYTRWNSWDIILRPAGLLFDVSDRLLYPTSHLQTYQTTAVLFLLLFSLYAVIWEAVSVLRRK